MCVFEKTRDRASSRGERGHKPDRLQIHNVKSQQRYLPEIPIIEQKSNFSQAPHMSPQNRVAIWESDREAVEGGAVVRQKLLLIVNENA